MTDDLKSEICGGKNVQKPILIVSMAEEVEGRDGSGYVVEKDSPVLDHWLGTKE